MSELHDPYLSSSLTSREQGLTTGTGQYYPPPRDVDRYASRPLPPPPPLSMPQSSSSSIYDYAADYLNQHTPQRLLASSYLENDRSVTPLGDAMNDEPLAIVPPLRLAISSRPESYENQRVESLSQRPDARLLALWANGDEQVSPVGTDTPRTEGWSSYVVSPLSEQPESGSMDAESWLDITSDETPSLDSSDCPPNEARPIDATSPQASYAQLHKAYFRHSDPVTPLGFDLGTMEFSEPGPDAEGPQHPAADDGRSPFKDINASTANPEGAFLVGRIDTFSSNRQGVSPRPVPPPLRLNDRPVSEDYLKTPHLPRRDSGPLPEMDGSSLGRQRRRSGLGSLGASIRSATQKIQKPPPGFTEVISLLDYQGARTPSVPRVKNILSKAKHGLGISIDDFKKDRKQDEFKS
ncbi:hypothetical protein F4861DRAFT_258470 [Xylaria intraflava]|nr:hypothetical protein F4861DRAFT_258470 [Xylaria intraflava]